MNAEYYCCEDIFKIDYYDKMISDTSQVWDCNYRLEIMPGEQNLDYDISSSEPIFIPFIIGM